jgi:predicted nucleic acid-binding protein
MCRSAKWFELGTISQSKGAEILGVSRAEFLEILAHYWVSPFQDDEEASPPTSGVPDIWIVNASPLIALDAISGVRLLAALAADVVVPDAVMSEVAAGPRPLSPDRLGRHRTVTVDGIHAVVAAWDLGSGESDVVSRAAREPGSVAIIDDRAARRCAAALGIPTKGTLRVLLDAKDAGLVTAVAPLIDGLRRAGLFLSEYASGPTLAAGQDERPDPRGRLWPPRAARVLKAGHPCE